MVIATIDKWRPPRAGVVALRAFHFDHLGTQISQRLTNLRARKDAGKFHDL